MKPQLVQTYLINKIKNSGDSNGKITFETYITNNIILFIQNNYKILLIILTIILSLCWRYYEVKKNKKNKYNDLYENDSDIESSEDS